MKVVGACNLDNKTIMKDFYFDEGTSENEISKVVDEWAESLFSSWYVICESNGDQRYGE